MRKYLVSGYITFHAPGQWVPFRGAATLTDEEVMDPTTIATVEGILLKEHNSGDNTVAKGFTITHFQPYETEPAASSCSSYYAELAKMYGNTIHLNECSVTMPPVDSPLLIEIAPGVLLKATRDQHAESRNDLLRFRMEQGGFFVGRPRWTHA